jgi:hypothetical protein
MEREAWGGFLINNILAKEVKEVVQNIDEFTLSGFTKFAHEPIYARNTERGLSCASALQANGGKSL